MEAKELRILNWINYYGKSYQVSSINSDETIRLYEDETNKDTIGCYRLKSEGFKPIPITEEWLLKIDQAKPESKLNLSFIFNSNCKMWVDKSNEKNHIWHYVWKGNYIQIKFLHHLQNIHYYLNNFEELTFNK
jgi:hypothetical protein